MRTEDKIDRSTLDRKPANQSRDEFAPELARNGQLVERFDTAREDDASQSHEVSLERGSTDSGSHMVRDAGPKLEPRPTAEVEKPVTRESFVRRWADEMRRNEVQFDKPIEQDLEHERDQQRTRDRER